MSDTEYIVGKCNQCGEELRIPAHLSQFSCMYCGAKLTSAQLVAEVTPRELDGDLTQLMESVKREIIRCIRDFPGQNKKISRNEYEPAFDVYEKACRSVFDDLDTACRLNPAGRTALVETAVDCFLNDLQTDWATRPGWKNKIKQAAIRDDDKMTVAIFMVPMVGHLKLSISDDFCEILQKKWVKRFPKSPFFIGSYDAIAGGFRRRFKLCFITTAVCEELGKPDNCEELTAFRAFRDGYLMESPDGQTLVEEYYNIAPGIVTCINLCGDREMRYYAIRKQYLLPCFEDLRAGRMESCKQRYVQMVRDLQAQYLH